MMSKKIEKLAVNVGCYEGTAGVWMYHDDLGIYDDRYFVSDNYRILELEALIKGMPVYTIGRIPELAKSFMDRLTQVNMTMHSLPEIDEIKEKVRAIRGRKYSIRVAVRFYENTPAVNVDYLIKGMEAFKSRSFWTEDGNRISPIYLLNNDDPQEIIKYMMFPVVSFLDEVGYRACETK